MELYGHTVRGVDVGAETRCRHYDSDLDVIAIRFPCCETFYPCYDCHLAVADHEPERWGDGAADVDGNGTAGVGGDGMADVDDDARDSDRSGADAPAVLCGICGTVLTVAEYLDCEDRCPDCGAEFNPGCRRHYDRYFAPALFEEEP